MRRLLDRQLRDVDHRAPEPAVHLLRLGLAPRRSRAARRTAGCARLRPSCARVHAGSRRAGSGRWSAPTTLAAVDVEQLFRRRDPLHHRDVRSFVAEEAEVDGERRLRGAGDTDEDEVGVVRGRGPTPSSNRTANSIASIRLKYAELSGGREPGDIVAAIPDTRATASIGWPSRSQ